jgi:phosphatidylglycerophosphate synthase
MTPDPEARNMYLLTAATVFAIVTLLAGWWGRGRHPFPRFGLANQVTTLRALLVALVAGTIVVPRQARVAVAAVTLSLVATALDGVDGWLARRTGMTSEFGARFDMEVDALLILTLAILVWRYDKAGAWVVLSGLLRYLFVAAGATIAWLREPLPPSRRRQTICVIQVAALIAALTPSIPWPASAIVAAGALAALSYSFLTDTLWLSHHAR